MGLKVAFIRAPVDRETQNDYEVRKFTATSTSAINSLPGDWAGCIVHVRCFSATDGAQCHVGFSKRSDSSIDEAETATAEGASDGVGAPLVAGEAWEPFELPDRTNGETIYFVRASTADCTVYVRRAS